MVLKIDQYRSLVIFLPVGCFLNFCERSGIRSPQETTRARIKFRKFEPWKFRNEPRLELSSRSKKIQNFEIVQFRKFHGRPWFRNNRFGWILAIKTAYSSISPVRITLNFSKASKCKFWNSMGCLFDIFTVRVVSLASLQYGLSLWYFHSMICLFDIFRVWVVSLTSLQYGLSLWHLSFEEYHWKLKNKLWMKSKLLFF